MFGPRGVGRIQAAAQKAKKPGRGWCKCERKPTDLDQSMISKILGSDAVCTKCNKHIKPK